MITVIGQDYIVTGLILGGADEGIAVSSQKEFEKEVEKALQRDDIEVLIISEDMLENADWQLKARLERIARPVIVAIPTLSSPEESSRLKELIRKTLGFDVVK
ncbi:MAG: V-type ATP synthase subunit F [Candidatus Anstonellales archaeon]